MTEDDPCYQTMCWCFYLMNWLPCVWLLYFNCISNFQVLPLFCFVLCVFLFSFMCRFLSLITSVFSVLHDWGNFELCRIFIKILCENLAVCLNRKYIEIKTFMSCFARHMLRIHQLTGTMELMNILITNVSVCLAFI